MAFSLGNMDVLSLRIQHSLTISTNSVNTSIERLSSGLRINSAKDDPAGLAIADRLEAQVRGQNQAKRNINDGISVFQTADGALGINENILQRIRELAVQSANDTYTDEDRQSFQDEADQLIAEIDRISSATEFNGMSLLDGTFQNKKLQVSATSGQNITFGFDEMSTATLGESSDTVDTINLTSQAGASKALDIADKAIAMIDDQRSYAGAMMNQLEFTYANADNMSSIQAEARSRIIDVDIASEVSSLTRSKILQQVGVAMLSQVQQQGQLYLNLLQ
jgi:flagellin